MHTHVFYINVFFLLSCSQRSEQELRDALNTVSEQHQRLESENAALRPTLLKTKEERDRHFSEASQLRSDLNIAKREAQQLQEEFKTLSSHFQNNKMVP